MHKNTKNSQFELKKNGKFNLLRSLCGTINFERFHKCLMYTDYLTKYKKNNECVL